MYGNFSVKIPSGQQLMNAKIKFIRVNNVIILLIFCFFAAIMSTSLIPSPFLSLHQVLLVSSIKRVFTLKSISLVIKGNIKMAWGIKEN